MEEETFDKFREATPFPNISHFMLFIFSFIKTEPVVLDLVHAEVIDSYVRTEAFGVALFVGAFVLLNVFLVKHLEALPSIAGINIWFLFLCLSVFHSFIDITAILQSSVCS